MDKVDAINFSPVDGCGSEIDLSTGNTVHLCESDTDALEAYMQSFAAWQSPAHRDDGANP